MSGGENQLVAIARALVNDPVLILADEPTGNLDSQMAEEILQLLEQINEEGATIIMVTHDNSIGERSHHLIRLLDGKSVASPEILESEGVCSSI